MSNSCRIPPTDVITFPGMWNGLAGEIAFAQKSLRTMETNTESFPEKLSLYLVHGYLHLCGFDDRCDETK